MVTVQTRYEDDIQMKNTSYTDHYTVFVNEICILRIHIHIFCNYFCPVNKFFYSVKT
jgi:hypothetical protein